VEEDSQVRDGGEAEKGKNTNTGVCASGKTRVKRANEVENHTGLPRSYASTPLSADNSEVKEPQGRVRERPEERPGLKSKMDKSEHALGT